MKQKQKPLSFSLHPDNHAYIEAAVMKQKETNHRYNRSMYMDDLITHLRTKAEVKPKLAKTNPTTPKELTPISFPINLDIAAWNKWVEFRKKAKFKAYKTDAAMKKLAKSEFNDQMPMVQQSIDNEYQGLFALKGVNNGQINGNNAGASKKLSAHERARAANAQYRNEQPNERELVVGANGRHLGGAVDEGERRATVDNVGDGTFVDY